MFMFMFMLCLQRLDEESIDRAIALAVERGRIGHERLQAFFHCRGCHRQLLLLLV